jgi:uncharacterized protein YfeS
LEDFPMIMIVSPWSKTWIACLKDFDQELDRNARARLNSGELEQSGLCKISLSFFTFRTAKGR